ncbi:MAG TPA: NAD(P)H-dependent oxidoreductase subunit E [Gemmatimonadaceae bacterium]|nr:NAD(P)H-dependent oxidoreductase subunit E [Gemmatimonadaceae bacterium]
MDLRLPDAVPTDAERSAVDAILGRPESAWDGGGRGRARDTHMAEFGGRASRARRHLLLPALQGLQARIGWISEGGLGYICARLDVPPAEAWGVATFYAMLATSPRPPRVLHVCDDIACRVHGATELCAALEHASGPPFSHAPAAGHITLDPDRAAWLHAPCLGMCDRAPAALLIEAGATPMERSIGGLTAVRAIELLSGADPGPDAAAQPPFSQRGQTHESGFALLARVGVVDPESLDAYRQAGGYAALARALEMGPESVIAEVNESRLVGRGGAAFPTARKWETVRRQPAQPHYLVCNADESEPGTFKDRVLLTEDPFAIVEAMTIAALATGCEKGFLYLRAEYPLAFNRMQRAAHAARDAGLLGERILGSGLQFDIEIRRGAGAYICGEETAIFESIEGKRGEPRNKPPFPVTHGLFGKPTIVNNVETLANVLSIVLRGGAAFARTGTAQSTGTRLFCLSGHVGAPGIYEVPMGTTLGALLDLAGGVRAGGRLTALLLGGAAGAFVRPDELGLKLTHEDTRAAGVTLGSGVVMAFDQTADLRDIVLRIAAFFRDESCGQCVPCRVGTVRQEEALHRIASGRTRGGLVAELALLDEVGAVMKDGSICGLGQTAYAAVESAVHRLGLYGPPAQAAL